MPKLSFTPKLHRFGRGRFAQNGVVLAILFLFLFFKKEGKKKKKKGNRGWLHPLRLVWGWPKPPPCPWGGPATPKGPKKKKGFVHMEVAGPPPRAWGWLRPPPCEQTHFFRSFFFFFWGVARPPPRAWGWLWPPYTGRRGWLEPPPISPFKKKKKTKMAKTTASFWVSPKWRSFGMNGSLDKLLSKGS
jgi:hypothetical protein